MNRFIFILLLAATAVLSSAADFSVSQGYDEAIGSKTYSSAAGTVQLHSADARWIWYVNVTKPGMYALSARVAVAAANAGATLEAGDFVPQHNVAGSSVSAVLASTHATSNSNPQWQSLGSVWVPSPGLRFFYVRIPQRPVADAGLIYALRVEGPGLALGQTAVSTRAAACDIYFFPEGATRRSAYTEMVPRPEPTPALVGTHTVVNTPTGYMGNNDLAFQSLWVSGGILPEVLVARGGSRVYTHEGTGSTIELADFYLDPKRRRKVLNISVTDHNNYTLTTFLVGEHGQRWHFGGRMRQPTISSAGSSGFLENQATAFNAQVTWRSCAWGNVWFHGQRTSGAAPSWWAADGIRAHLRGPGPTTLPTTPGTYVYGKSRQRQDMVEMVIGGQIYASGFDTIYNSLPSTAPELPTLNHAYQLQPREQVNQAAHATVGTVYSDTTSLPAQVRDPFNNLPLSYAKASGPSWLSVSSSGALSGTPAAGDAGQNVFIVQATDTAAGLSGEFTLGVYVRTASGNQPPAFREVAAQKMTTATVDDPRLIRLPVTDPDSTGLTYSITSGNAALFGFDGEWLVKTAPLTAGQNYPLTVQVADGTGLTASTNVQITAVTATGGVTEDVWYNVPGPSAISSLTSDPRYPASPTQQRMLGNWSETYTSLSTGYRQRAWVTPTTSGNYLFSISSTTTVAELRVSTDDTAANLVLRDTHNGTNGGSGTSVALVAGQRYYIEALAMNGDDYIEGTLAIKWQGPGISTQTIPAAFLTPIECATPKLWDGTFTCRSVVAGEPCSDHLRTKLETIHLHSSLVYQKLSGPAWLTLGADGSLTGTPGAGDVGSATFTVRATAPGGHFDEAEFILPVIANAAPVFTQSTTTLSAINEGQSISGTVATLATDANASPLLGYGDTLTYRIIAGPPWLQCEPTGELCGTPGPAHLGANTFTVQATDRAGATSTATLQITVNDVPTTPVITGSPIVVRTLTGSTVNALLSAYVYDPDTGDTLTFEKLTGPAWLSLASSGALTGSPLASHLGNNTVTFKVTDSTGRIANGTVRVEVADGQIFAYEPFEGIAGANINATTGGVGFSTAWSGDVAWDFSSPGLTFSGLPAVGLKSTLGAQGTTLLRPLSQAITIGQGEADRSELWVSARMDLNTVSGVGHGVRVDLYQDNVLVGYFGKGVNFGLGFDIGGSGFRTVTGSLGSSTGTEGAWLLVLKFTAQPGDATRIDLYAAKDSQIAGDPVKLRDPFTHFPHKSNFNVTGKISFNRLGMYRWNNTASFMDELRVASTLPQAVPVDMTAAPSFNSSPILRSYAAQAEFSGSLNDDISDASAGDVKVFTKISGPDWLTLNANGSIIGTPPAGSEGIYDISVRVTDAAGNTATGTLRITVTPPVFTLSYSSDPGGSLTGTLTQNVQQGSNGTAVTAVPDFGWIFTGWSDSTATNPRTDTNVSAHKSVTASFSALSPIVEVVTATAANGIVNLQFRATAGSTCHIERSYDLINWTTIASDLIAPSNGQINTTDTPPTIQPRAFYRLVLE